LSGRGFALPGDIRFRGQRKRTSKKNTHTSQQGGVGQVLGRTAYAGGFFHSREVDSTVCKSQRRGDFGPQSGTPVAEGTTSYTAGCGGNIKRKRGKKVKRSPSLGGEGDDQRGVSQ